MRTHLLVGREKVLKNWSESQAHSLFQGITFDAYVTLTTPMSTKECQADGIADVFAMASEKILLIVDVTGPGDPYTDGLTIKSRNRKDFNSRPN